MNHKNKIFALFLILCLTSQSALAADWSSMTTGTSNMFSNTQSMDDDSFESDEDTVEDESEDIGDDDVSGSDEDTEQGDLAFDTDATIEMNKEVTGNIVAEKNLKIETNVKIDGNVVVKGNLTLAPNVEITGYVKVNGDITLFTNSKIEGTIYGYKNINAGVNVETSGKLKSAGVLVGGVNYSGEGKLYAFGGKKFGVNAEFKDVKEKGILGKLDAYLKIDLASENFAKVKELSATYDIESAKVVTELKKLRVAVSVANAKLKLADADKTALETEIADLNTKIDAQKAAGKKLVETLIAEVETYIEDEEFDIKGVTFYVKNDELARFELGGAQAKVVVNTIQDKVSDVKKDLKDPVVTSVTKNEKLKATMKGLLEKKLAKFDTEKRNKMYLALLGKLDKMIEKTKAPKMQNTLILLREVVLELQEDAGLEADIDNLLQDEADSSTDGVTQSSGTQSAEGASQSNGAQTMEGTTQETSTQQQ